MTARDLERDLLRVYRGIRRTLLLNLLADLPPGEATAILGAMMRVATTRIALRMSERLTEAYFAGSLVGSAKAGVGFTIGQTNIENLNRIKNQTIGQIGKFNVVLEKQLKLKFKSMEYDFRTINLLSEKGWTSGMEKRLRVMGLSPQEISVVKHQTTAQKMVRLIEQRGIKLGVHPNQVAREMRPYIRAFFDGSERVVWDNTGKYRRVLNVNADGKYSWGKRKITRPYVSNVKAYSESVSRTSIARAQREGFFDGVRQNPELIGWYFTTVGDSSVRPEHMALQNGRLLPIDTDLQPPIDVNCRCTLTPVYSKESGIRSRSPKSLTNERDRWFFKESERKKQNVPTHSFLKGGTLDKMPKDDKALRNIRKEVLK
jgi:hypothetical protein